MDADYDRTNRLNWTYRIADISQVVRELRVQGYWDDVRHLMDDRLRASSLTTPRPYSMQTDATTQVYGGKLGATLALGGGTLKTGIDYYNRNWNAVNRRAGYFAYRDTAMIPDVSVDNLGMFGEYRLPLAPQVTLSGGLREDLTWIETDKSNPLAQAGDSRRFDGVSANLQLTYRPASWVTLFTGAARGNRTPDQQELYLDVPVATPSATATYWHGSKDLQATVNHQADVGARFHTDTFYVNLSMFYSDLQDYINLEQVPGTFEKSYRNVHASMWGAELSSELVLFGDLFLRGSMSFVEGENLSGDRPLSEIPPLAGTISARYDNGVWFFEAAENLAREQDRVDSGLQETVTAGWATTDLKGGIAYGGWSLVAGVQNLFDRQYYSHLSYARDPFQSGIKVPENGRNLYLSMSYRF
nr:TonB-dependent receptor [Geomonas sp. Red32]